MLAPDVREKQSSRKRWRWQFDATAAFAPSFDQPPVPDRQLIEQNRRFDAALENMSQGLCMFDADGRLLVWNKRYLEIFGLRTDHLCVGMSQRQIIEILVNLGRYTAGATVETLSEGTRTSLSEGQATSILRELADGRTVSATHRAMTGGGWVATFEDVTERRRNEDRIAYMARHDALTDLPNRVSLHEFGNAMLDQPMLDRSLAVLCLDLDRFKLVNDGFGHALGDRLLRCVAHRLRRQVRNGATVARVGGDEFVVLHLVKDLKEAEALTRRLIAAVSAPYDFDGLQIEIDMSAGIVLSGKMDRDVTQLLQSADLALYQAKLDGRGVFRVFEPQMDESARARLGLERELREALINGRFEVHYQPLVELSSNDVVGLEALVRWRHAERGLVSPAMFIPIAEETGLIVPLGEWVLRRACEDAKRWPGHVCVAVNVSAHQLRQRTFATMVLSVLSESGLDPKRLELEITESVLLDETDANLETLHVLRAHGIRIAMDDFGTGYSSISYLRRFPFDKIKIDRSFIREIGEKPEAAAIIRAIIGLGQSLNMTTLVEGIETDMQRRAVLAEGAHEMQGFLFSPPRPAPEVDALFGVKHSKTRAA
ncbi:EAL domain-containing protein (plasmid) [Methylobacterium sp. NMS12]|uniref:putative bifunctional diguanylate cyclase/phosphodiesterase n=1 Tax=Methylobacterium sp. NMS12 TaxID=3079766 RepID=UPI003F881887